uniref:Uncharacterized protein n=1 Tax=Oryza sativa subsp. japonica TaxID=39947 RepID=Q6K1Q7_ORYSJ|nr:hypothetical protein [Oryza sativa Japonica Group]BAD23795.1 hypothetical protein [Oryza sativa Japonica Group]
MRRERRRASVPGDGRRGSGNGSDVAAVMAATLTSCETNGCAARREGTRPTRRRRRRSGPMSMNSWATGGGATRVMFIEAEYDDSASVMDMRRLAGDNDEHHTEAFKRLVPEMEVGWPAASPPATAHAQLLPPPPTPVARAQLLPHWLPAVPSCSTLMPMFHGSLDPAAVWCGGGGDATAA